MPTAFFDFDGTLIEGDSILYWHRHYYARRPWMRPFQLAGWAGLILYGARLIDSHMLKRIYLWPLSFEKPDALDALGSGFVLGNLAHRFHGPVLARLWAHHRLGHRVVVISASGTFYLRHLADLMPPGTVVLGTEMQWGGGLLRLPSYRGGNLRGPNKIRRLRDLGFSGDGKGGFAYSDHPHDIPLLEFVDHPACIRPTRAMEAEAKRRGWPIREWPRARAAWKVKAEAACLLLFAWAPGFLAAAKEPAAPDEAEVEKEMERIGAETARTS